MIMMSKSERRMIYVYNKDGNLEMTYPPVGGHEMSPYFNYNFISIS